MRRLLSAAVSLVMGAAVLTGTLPASAATPNGEPDAAFNDTLSTALAGSTASLGLNNVPRATVWDGTGYLIGGEFTNGPGDGTGNRSVFRVKADGSLDTAFNNTLADALGPSGGLNAAVNAIAWDGTGYLIGGNFSNGPGLGSGSKRVFRIHSDGSLDTGFNDNLTRALGPSGGLDSSVFSVEWDGTGYLVGGVFSGGPGTGPGSKRVFRVWSDGSLDSGFNNTLTNALPAGLNSSVFSIEWDGSGYLIGGSFTTVPDGKRVFRVKADGSLDTSFDDTLATALAPDGLNNSVSSVEWDGNGYLIGGRFTNAPGTGSAMKPLARIKTDGSVDAGFADTLFNALAPLGLDAEVAETASDGSGYLIVGGFSNAPGAGNAPNSIFRVAGSTPDPDPGPGPEPDPTPSPAPPVAPQKPRGNCVTGGGLASIPRAGTKRLMKSKCRTTAGTRIGVRVTAAPVGRGDVVNFRLVCGKNSGRAQLVRAPAGKRFRMCSAGALRIATYGQKLTARVVWKAPATGSHPAYRKAMTYRT